MGKKGIPIPASCTKVSVLSLGLMIQVITALNGQINRILMKQLEKKDPGIRRKLFLYSLKVGLDFPINAKTEESYVMECVKRHKALGEPLKAFNVDADDNVLWQACGAYFLKAGEDKNKADFLVHRTSGMEAPVMHVFSL